MVLHEMRGAVHAGHRENRDAEWRKGAVMTDAKGPTREQVCQWWSDAFCELDMGLIGADEYVAAKAYAHGRADALEAAEMACRKYREHCVSYGGRGDAITCEGIIRALKEQPK